MKSLYHKMSLNTVIKPCVLLLFLFLAFTGFSQIPEQVLADDYQSTKESFEGKVVPCNLNDAGTFIIGGATAQSNDLTLDTLFLCFNDEVNIEHNGDQRLDGDPNKSTPAGVGYAFYECKPTVDGPTLAAIEADPCLIKNTAAPANLPSFYIVSQGRLDGNVRMFNQGAIQTTFNSGDPYLVWFAPITFDAIEQQGGQNFPKYEGTQNCVSVSVQNSFAVVYLNQLQTSSPASNGCLGSFLVQGGLPEWDNNKEYDVTIINNADNSLRGSVLNPEVNSGQTLRYSVPAAGTYTVTITDDKGCQTSTFTADHTSCVPSSKVTISIDSIIGAPGSTVCVPIRVDGFQDIVAFQFNVDYDETMLRFTGFQNVAVSPFGPSEYNDNGDRVNLGTFTTGAPFTVPSGGVLMEICFEVIGVIGDIGVVKVNENSGSGANINFTNSSSQTLGYETHPGAVIVSNSALEVVLNQTEFGCFGESKNSLTGRTYGGSAPYNISWKLAGTTGSLGNVTVANTGSPFITPSNLTAGNYEITITDNAGTVITRNITINDDQQLTVRIIPVNDLDCNGDSNGALKAEIAVGNVLVSDPGANYTFTWNTTSNAQAINGLAAGTYSVTVEDNVKKCQASANSTIFAPAKINATINTTDASCIGVANGELDIRPTGGTTNTGRYDITITNPDGSSNTQTLVNLQQSVEPGTYTINIKDDNGCNENFTETINPLRVVSLAVDTSIISCSNTTDGGFIVTAGTTTGTSTGLYTFAWQKNTTTYSTGITNTNTQSTITNLDEGTYSVTATDSDGCIANFSYTLIKPTQLQMGFTGKTDESCTPGNDGTASITVIGGREPAAGYNITWYDENRNVVSNSTTATGLTEGSYMAVVIDSTGCIDSLNSPLSINAPDKPQITSLPDFSLACNGLSNGELTVTATATSSPIDRYVWNNGLTTPTINNLTAGTYIVEVFDQAGCVRRDTAQVTQPDTLKINNTILTIPTCFKGDNGKIELDVIGGTSPYNFEWSNGSTGTGLNILSGPGISEGNYTVKITDANNCAPVNEQFYLDDPEGINPTPSNFVDASCSIDVCNGGLTVSAALPGNPSAMFDFTWSSGETSTNTLSSSASQLCGGRVTVEIQETSKVCPPQEFSFNIGAPLPMVLELSAKEDVKCFGESNGSIKIDTILGGTPEFTYSWTYGTNTASGKEVLNLPATMVYLEVTDDNGCPFRDTIEISQPDKLDLFLDTAGTQSPDCAGDMNGVISLKVLGGNNGSFTYRWNDDPSRNSPVARELESGQYTIQVVDAKGCIDTLSHTLNGPSPIEYTLNPIPALKCFGDIAELSFASVTGGNGTLPQDYQVSINGSSFQPITETFQVPGGVTFPITIIDPNDCKLIKEETVPSPPPITLRLPTEVEVELGDSIRLRPDIFPGGAPIVEDSTRWTPLTNISFQGGNPISPYVSPIEDTKYTITVIDENNCTEEASILVKVDRNRNVFIPNAFSPNNDATNDQFKIFTGPGVKAINYLKVFNRWGEMIYAQENLELNAYGQVNGWDGTYKNKLVDIGTYIYITEIEFLDGRVLLYKGDVNILY